MALEIKAGKNIKLGDSIPAFKKKFPKVPLIIVSMSDEHKRIIEEVELYPCESAIKMIRDL